MFHGPAYAHTTSTEKVIPVKSFSIQLAASHPESCLLSSRLTPDRTHLLINGYCNTDKHFNHVPLDIISMILLYFNHINYFNINKNELMDGLGLAISIDDDVTSEELFDLIINFEIYDIKTAELRHKLCHSNISKMLIRFRIFCIENQKEFQKLLVCDAFCNVKQLTMASNLLKEIEYYDSVDCGVEIEIIDKMYKDDIHCTQLELLMDVVKNINGNFYDRWCRYFDICFSDKMDDVFQEYLLEKAFRNSVKDCKDEILSILYAEENPESIVTATLLHIDVARKIKDEIHSDIKLSKCKNIIQQICDGLCRYYQSLDQPYDKIFSKWCALDDVQFDGECVDDILRDSVEECDLIDFAGDMNKNGSEFPFNDEYRLKDRKTRQEYIYFIIQKCAANRDVNFLNGYVLGNHKDDQ